MDTIRLFQELEHCDNILLAGAGGGFDFFCGLPLFFALQKKGKNVHLANLSFSNLDHVTGNWIAPGIVEINAGSDGSVVYFPEKYLCEWFESLGMEQTVYCLERTGFSVLAPSYNILAETLDLDAIVLIDGGTDSLMRGDECDLGTPHEDILSIACVHDLDVSVKALVCLGFGIDAFHGVCHAHCLEAIADLSKHDGYWGAFSIHERMPEVQKYMEAVEYVFAKMPKNKSIVNASIVSALEGHYGNYHKTTRTEGSELWINPLMSMYWSFDLDAVAKRVLYLDWIRETTSFHEIVWRIAAFQKSLEHTRSWKDIPI